jgi:alkylation response protein AidB-like acyl-CoA dehydrogenase
MTEHGLMTAGGLDIDVRAEFRSSVRAALAGAAVAQRSVWQTDSVDADALARVAALGWTGLLVDEQWDGAGAGMQYAVIVAEELGAQLSPLPFLSNAVLAATGLAVGASPAVQAQWLPRIASGAARATVALTGPTGRAAPDLLDLRALDGGPNVLLNGGAGFVLDAPEAELLIVAARRPGDAQPVLYAVDAASAGVRISDHLAVDRTRALATVTLDDVRVDAAAMLPGSAAAIEAMLARGCVALAADALGAARRALDMAVAYAKQREQFGRPIGSFQAIKHRLADMYVLVEGAALAVYGAAQALDEGSADGARLVAVAGSFARDAATKVTGDAIQVHGGIGYTWEHDCHRLFKRAKFDELYLSDPAAQRETLARLMLNGPAAGTVSR